MYGIRTREQLLAAGVAASTIDDRCRRGVYTRVLPRVYCVDRLTTLARCAAVVAWLPTATLSHRTAAWLRQMADEPDVVEATIPRHAHRATPDWLRLYRRDLPSAASDEAWGLPITSRAVTLLDCVAVLPELAAGQLVDKCLGGLVPPEEVLELGRCGAHGSPVLRRQLREAACKAASEPERLFARAMARTRIKLAPNHPVGPYVCDFVHTRSRTIVEIDGREFHSDHDVFRRDRRRQNWLLLHRWLVLRYAAADVFNDMDHCVDEVVAVIRNRRRKS
ncbi:DUF559 domain-containing protein [Nocardia wallacei]|uniref:DUF559 domain-containing protein n=1 Tax=Nocardia wallacei TaxID=480035 RepID=UPI002454366C|nr:DUF559 domain-containing protein [Nocardia wallacei]